MKSKYILIFLLFAFFIIGCDSNPTSPTSTTALLTVWDDRYPSDEELAQSIEIDEIVCDYIQENDIDYVKITIVEEGFYTIELLDKFPALSIYWFKDEHVGAIDGIEILTTYDVYLFSGTYTFEISFDDNSFLPIERYYSFYITKK